MDAPLPSGGVEPESAPAPVRLRTSASRSGELCHNDDDRSPALLLPADTSDGEGRASALEQAGEWRLDTGVFRRGHTDAIQEPLKKKTAAFYRQQSALIDAYLLAHARLTGRDNAAAHGRTRGVPPPSGDAAAPGGVAPSAAALAAGSGGEPPAQPTEERTAAVAFAINLTFGVNILLFVLKIFAAAYSGRCLPLRCMRPLRRSSAAGWRPPQAPSPSWGLRSTRPWTCSRGPSSSWPRGSPHAGTRTATPQVRMDGARG